MSNYISSRKLRKSYIGNDIEKKEKEEKNTLGIRMLLSSLLILGSFVFNQYYFDELSANKEFMQVYNMLKQKTGIESILNVTKVNK